MRGLNGIGAGILPGSVPAFGDRLVGDVAEGGEIALGVQGRLTTGPRGGDGLPVGAVDQVSGSEDAVEVGPGAGGREHVAVLVEIDLPLHEVTAGLVPDGDEQPAH